MRAIFTQTALPMECNERQVFAPVVTNFIIVGAHVFDCPDDAV
jgi:hypothetical protein